MKAYAIIRPEKVSGNEIQNKNAVLVRSDRSERCHATAKPTSREAAGVTVPRISVFPRPFQNTYSLRI
jgi:hypothetical protein